MPFPDVSSYRQPADVKQRKTNSLFQSVSIRLSELCCKVTHNREKTIVHSCQGIVFLVYFAYQIYNFHAKKKEIVLFLRRISSKRKNPSKRAISTKVRKNGLIPGGFYPYFHAYATTQKRIFHTHKRANSLIASITIHRNNDK